MVAAGASAAPDLAALADWLAASLPHCGTPLRLAKFPGGQSNPTFLVETTTGRWVLRKQPPGALAESAHALDREFRVLQALEDSAVPVPRPLAYCADRAVLGTTFYLMEHCAGAACHDPLLPGFAPAARAAVYAAMNAALAALHGLDWRRAGLGDFGRPEGYLARQLARWQRQNAASGEPPDPDLDSLARWLTDHLPGAQYAALVHGDYRLGNLLCTADPAGVVAVLDWELATIGDPLADLAYSCMTYRLPAGHPVSAGFLGADTGALGIPSEDACLAAYQRCTGLDPAPHWRFHVAFSLYRTACIQRGVYARARAGNASSPTARLFGDSWPMVAAAGLAAARAG